MIKVLEFIAAGLWVILTWCIDIALIWGIYEVAHWVCTLMGTSRENLILLPLLAALYMLAKLLVTTSNQNRNLP